MNADLVFDLGLNDGADSAAYLAKGFRVVAVEANPDLCDLALWRYVGDSRIQIVNAALWETSGFVDFYVNTANDHWSSVDPGWAGREDSPCRVVRVPSLTLGDLFCRYGVPFYLKIDIEGADILALAQLAASDARPAYVSVEDCRFGPEYLRTLAGAGYGGFKLIDQSVLPPGTSGPFGEDTPGEWMTLSHMRSHYWGAKRDRTPGQWFDIHARFG